MDEMRWSQCVSEIKAKLPTWLNPAPGGGKLLLLAPPTKYMLIVGQGGENWELLTKESWGTWEPLVTGAPIMALIQTTEGWKLIILDESCNVLPRGVTSYFKLPIEELVNAIVEIIGEPCSVIKKPPKN